MVKNIAGIFIAILLATFFSLTIGAIAAGPPPPPEPDISVNNQDIPFGNVTVGNTSDQTVTVTNYGNINLNIGQIANANPIALPFSILNDNCSNSILTPEGNCTITVRFEPTSETADNDSFDIQSDDPDDPDDNSITISVSGTSYPRPKLVYPANGLTGMETTLEFRWEKSSYSDVTYDLYVCEDSSFTTGCKTEENITSLYKDYIYFAGSGLGFLLFGIVLADGGRNKKGKMVLLISMIIMVTVFAISRGSGGGDPVKVTVSGTVYDVNARPVLDAEVTISSNPVTVTTGSSGTFSTKIEVGTHEIEIKKDSEEIYKSTFSCEKDTSLGDLNTSYDKVTQLLSGLKTATTYYWKVIANYGNGVITESGVRSFTTK